MTDKLLTPRDAAALLQVTTTTLADAAERGQLKPARTPGGHNRYWASEVEALARSLGVLRDYSK